MVADYPAAAALRRRRTPSQAAGPAPAPPPTAAASVATRRRPPRPQVHLRNRRFRLSRLYTLASILIAILALVTTNKTSRSSSSSVSLLNASKRIAEAQELKKKKRNKRKRRNKNTDSNNNNNNNNKKWFGLFQKESSGPTQIPPQPPVTPPKQKLAPAWIRWALPKKDEDELDTLNEQPALATAYSTNDSSNSTASNSTTLAYLQSWIDPALLNPKASTPTDLIDKILTSTPRLLAVSNLLVSMTYLLHTVVAHLFLGVAPSSATLPHGEWAGRERLGGFLVFKLLLVSAVVQLDTFDLLILLSWYTCLSFLRSLAGLAASTTSHTVQSGQAPRPGVGHLLWLVLACNILAAVVCVALFHGAGFGMVVLLTCDCALLGTDVLCHLLRHASQLLDQRHTQSVSRLETQQLRLHNRNNNSSSSTTARQEDEEHELQQQRRSVENAAADSQEIGETSRTALWDETEESFGHHHEDDELEEPDEEEEQQEQQPMDEETIQEQSRALDQRMERMEAVHNNRLSMMETTVFLLELLGYGLTVAHFLHIWSLHGLQFSLIDGVLAMHLHSAISSAAKKIAERRNLNRIARDLDAMFEDPTDLDMKNASACGDVCCICLGTMSTGNVKRVGCGHLYHTHCLREVVERARSIEAARCPLCRSSVLDGRPATRPDEDRAVNNNGDNNNAAVNNNNNNMSMNNSNNTNNNNGNQNEHALFRFSTEGVLPSWLPLPAFSFEVVRRPPMDFPMNDQQADNNTNSQIQDPNLDGVNENDTAETEAREPQANEQQQPLEQQQERNGERSPSFWRRLLILAGALPMTPEEEQAALEQLVDMFPQYDRADLLRELRARGSSEGVVDSVLAGTFSGVPRGHQQQNQSAQEQRQEQQQQATTTQRQNGGEAVQQGENERQTQAGLPQGQASNDTDREGPRLFFAF